MVCKNVSEKPISRPKHRKGLWSPEEDHKLRDYILKHGHGCWSSVPINAGLQRNGKSCRLRWINYLRPGLKKGNFGVEEEETILTLHSMLGNKWSHIANHLPGRTDNEIKNYWHSYLKKSTVAKPNQQETETHPTPSLSLENTPSSSSSSSSMNESSAQISDNQQEAKQIGVQLPKVFFAEWLSLDRVQQETLMDKAKTETVPCSSSMEVVDSSYGDLINDDEFFGFGFELQEDQNSVFGDQFCSGFQMIDDMMYI